MLPRFSNDPSLPASESSPSTTKMSRLLPRESDTSMTPPDLPNPGDRMAWCPCSWSRTLAWTALRSLVPFSRVEPSPTSSQSSLEPTSWRVLPHFVGFCAEWQCLPGGVVSAIVLGSREIARDTGRSSIVQDEPRDFCPALGYAAMRGHLGVIRALLSAAVPADHRSTRISVRGLFLLSPEAFC